MAILGIILIVVGFVLAIPLLWIIGLILLLAGLFFFARPVGGRRWY
jgi:hypothetical protein